MPKVSVVIPTRNRPEIVQVAIRSVLNQTYRDLDLVVVVDGPDPATVQALQSISDPRMRVIVNPENMGLAEARNVGVRNSDEEWVAFLDDDDEWLPEKLEKQVAEAEKLGGTHVFVPTRFIEKTESLERTLPEALPVSTYRFSEYMYCRRGFLLPSSFFASRQLLLDVPFTKGLRHMEDIDWLLRAMAHPATQVAAVPEPMVIYNDPNVPNRESKNVPWTVWLNWVVANRRLLTPRAFSLYISKHCVRAAKEGKEPLGVFIHLFLTALVLGSMSFACLTSFLAWGLFPAPFRRKVRRIFSVQARRSSRLVNAD
jgi:glycosyltransferase involved in cell wall biosynthesis